MSPRLKAMIKHFNRSLTSEQDFLEWCDQSPSALFHRALKSLSIEEKTTFRIEVFNTIKSSKFSRDFLY